MELTSYLELTDGLRSAVHDVVPSLAVSDGIQPLTEGNNPESTKLWKDELSFCYR
jgi:hypothetical protein